LEQKEARTRKSFGYNMLKLQGAKVAKEKSVKALVFVNVNKRKSRTTRAKRFHDWPRLLKTDALNTETLPTTKREKVPTTRVIT